jgi:hypothetical protein
MLHIDLQQKCLKGLFLSIWCKTQYVSGYENICKISTITNML